MENNWYVYVHENNGICFYVGIGKQLNRWVSRKGRNKYWHNVVKLNGGSFNAHKVLEGLTKEEACLREIHYIKAFRMHKAAKTNLTDGGEGLTGYVRSPESRKKIAERMKGNCYGKGNKNWSGRKHSEETKRKNSEAQKGRTPHPNSMAAPYSQRKPILCHQNNTTYESLNAAAKALSIPVCNIRMVLNGKRKSAGGFTFSLPIPT